ncbi:hypothetical protein AB0M47_04780 [Hamadaea sp. NPDC051192]|uniref:hypothetical protein n=1 Tax=Hamadaea sp. NPDC051192 TaxID=3154940 RepID=UPI003427B6CC
MEIRNSKMLAIFVEIVCGPQGTLRAVEIAGGGIAAEARCTLSTLADKMESTGESETAAPQDALAFADRLEVLGQIEDDLDALWKSRQSDVLGDLEFEAALARVVDRLRDWPVDKG